MTNLYKKSEQLCWSCKNSCGNCSWSKTFTPIVGWVAKKVSYPFDSYKIISCPEYISDNICEKCKHCENKDRYQYYNLVCKLYKINNASICLNFDKEIQ